MSDSDRSGRSQMGKNVLASWLTYGIFIVFGFAMPRAIDEAIGQAALGVWDFAWSIVHYMSLSMVGIGSSVNRYVARYRSQHDEVALSRTMSSVNAIQIGIGVFVAISSVFLSRYIPHALSAQLGEQSEVAGSLILYLGLALAFQMAFDVFRGILTGCHKWVAYNVLNAGGYAVAASGMLLALLFGGGLKEMAIIYLVMTIATEFARAFIGRRVCPEIEFSVANVNLDDAKKMVTFGVKTVLVGLPRMITIQTVNIFVVANMGIVMLAILARPLALIGHVMALIQKFGNVLTPTAGSLQGSGKTDELHEFALSSMRTGWLLAVLPMVFLGTLGDKIVLIWMGPGYENIAVIAILAAGTLISSSQIALLKIMIGLNAHGRIAKQCLINSVVALAIGSVIVDQYGWSLVAAACLIIIPSIVGSGIVAPYIGCKHLAVSPTEYLTKVLRDPLILIMVTVPALLAVRYFGPQHVLANLAVGSLVHIIVAGYILRKDMQIAYLRVLRPKVV